MKYPIKIFYHVFNPKPEFVQSLFNEQIQRVINSGLLDEAKGMYVSITGSPELKILEHPKITYLYQTRNTYEASTINLLREHAISSDCFALYMHTKGASYIGHPSEPNVIAWRHFMEYFNIDKWRNCVEALENGYDCVGVNWWGDHKFPHFSGNFWWTTSDYVRTLPVMISDRLRCEFWIGQNNPKAISLCDNGKAFYTTFIDENEYRET